MNSHIHRTYDGRVMFHAEGKQPQSIFTEGFTNLFQQNITLTKYVNFQYLPRVLTRTLFSPTEILTGNVIVSFHCNHSLMLHYS